MKNVVAEIAIENGGGNHQPIYDLIFEMFDMGGTAKSRGFDSTLAYAQKFWDDLCKIDCEKFYLPSGAKVTRPLKALLEEQFGKEAVKLAFAEFCKRVGNIYIEIKAQATLRNHYFTIGEGGNWTDDGSCFLDDGCNMHCGQWIDASPGIGVITIKPENKTYYSKGRIIVWFKSPTEAHMVNLYTGRGGERELPKSIFVKALEVMSGAKISWKQTSEETLVIYLNRSPLVLTCTEGNFDSICQEYLFKCTECGKKYEYDANHTWSEDAYYNACSDKCIDLLTDDADRVECHECSYRIHHDNAFHAQGEYYCESCYNDRFFYCDCCDEDCHQDDAVEVVNGRHTQTVCSDCAGERYIECEECGRRHENDSMAETTPGTFYCERCAPKCTAECRECGKVYDGSAVENFRDGLCEDCIVEEAEEVA
jgi:hypothetical protein